MSQRRSYPNIPVHIESFVHPHVPSFTGNLRRLYAVCQGKESVLRSYVERTPFELRSDLFFIEVADYSNRVYPPASETWPFQDCGIIVPIRYRDIDAGYYLFEYENQDYAIFAGRELWGYPKTFGDVTLEERPERIIGSVTKAGHEIVRLTGDRAKPLARGPELKLGPILNIHTVPRADGPGIFSQRIILRDASPGLTPISEEFFEASLTLRSVRLNQLEELGPLRVLGGGFQTADYTMEGDWGWGHVLETLV